MAGPRRSGAPSLIIRPIAATSSSGSTAIPAMHHFLSWPGSPCAAPGQRCRSSRSKHKTSRLPWGRTTEIRRRLAQFENHQHLKGLAWCETAFPSSCPATQLNAIDGASLRIGRPRHSPSSGQGWPWRPFCSASPRRTITGPFRASRSATRSALGRANRRCERSQTD
jgi:hypothetical protein